MPFPGVLCAPIPKEPLQPPLHVFVGSVITNDLRIPLSTGSGQSAIRQNNAKTNTEAFGHLMREFFFNFSNQPVKSRFSLLEWPLIIGIHISISIGVVPNSFGT